MSLLSDLYKTATGGIPLGSTGLNFNPLFNPLYNPRVFSFQGSEPQTTAGEPVVTPEPKTIAEERVVTPDSTRTSDQPTGSVFSKTKTSAGIPSEYINPETGTFYRAEDFAKKVASSVPRRGTYGGDIPTYAGNTLTQGPKTAEQLAMEAAALNNARNDIATGATDPYKVASQSGIAYSPSELSAIEKAYAGIYDPAINSALEKLNRKQEEDAAALEQKNKLEQMAKQFEYDKSLKQTPTYADSNTSTGLGGSGAAYVEGANPIVDGWVQRLNQSGQDINAAIPGVKNQALRDAVMLGLNATKAQSAKSAGTLDDINTISTMLANPQLENISGFADQLIGGLFGKAKTAKTQYNQIVGALQLAKAGQIKGQGQISDYERKVLKEASAAVDRGMNDEEFRKALVKLRGVLQTSSGLEAKVKITDPTTGQSDVQNLNTSEINGFISDGAIIEYLE